MKKGGISIVAILLATTLLMGCVTAHKQEGTREPLWEAGTERTKIVVLSDIHLGVDDAYAEIVENKPYLIEFLNRIATTTDIREVVLNGDVLDEWYLPLSYVETDRDAFYRKVIDNNAEVIKAFGQIMDSGIKVVYVVGNHDMSVEGAFIEKVIEGISVCSDRLGLGLYRTGDCNEIAIEHGHRYDVFSAPDTITNAHFVAGDTMFPPGYFYARYAADWVIKNKPSFRAELPEITTVPDRATDPDQFAAYAYYKVLATEFNRITLGNAFDEKLFDIRIDGYDDTYSVQDMFPVLNEKGEISAQVLYPNYQRTWEARQAANGVKVQASFAEATLGSLSSTYLESQARAQFALDKPESDTSVVLFGHSHIPELHAYGNGRFYANTGTWIDHNTNFQDTDGSPLSRTFAVITTNDTDIVELYQYCTDGTLRDMQHLRVDHL